jgi:hypothetical protein
LLGRQDRGGVSVDGRCLPQHRLSVRGVRPNIDDRLGTSDDEPMRMHVSDAADGGGGPP